LKLCKSIGIGIEYWYWSFEKSIGIGIGENFLNGIGIDIGIGAKIWYCGSTSSRRALSWVRNFANRPNKSSRRLLA